MQVRAPRIIPETKAFRQQRALLGALVVVPVFQPPQVGRTAVEPVSLGQRQQGAARAIHGIAESLRHDLGRFRLAVPVYISQPADRFRIFGEEVPRPIPGGLIVSGPLFHQGSQFAGPKPSPNELFPGLSRA